MDIFNFNNDSYEAKKVIAEGKRKISSIATITVVMVVILAIVSIGLTVFLTKQSLYNDIYNQITEQIATEKLTEYARDYYIPAGYTDDTVAVVTAGAKSVVTLSSIYYDYTEGSEITSSGSGFVVTSAGHIITNAHVVTHSNNGRTTFNYSLKATLYGTTTALEVEKIAVDTSADLAIIKLKNAPASLNVVTFGDSDALNMGQKVVAIGNAGGLGISATMGVISRPSEILKVDTDYGNTKVIQTDAAVNPGNSGGPLLDYHTDTDGAPTPYCIGVVSFKLQDTDSNTYEGMGFAVASSEIIEFLDKNNVTGYQTCKAN